MGDNSHKATKGLEVVGCWVSPGWSDGLTVPSRPDWSDTGRPEAGMSGLVTVLVARGSRDGEVTVCGYLVDAYCLGIKDAWGPRLMYGRDLRDFVAEYFSAYQAPPLPASLELARQLVFGAVDYARGLGFEPHPDFATATGHLGEWAGPGVITFGREGRPMFVQGSKDNAAEIMRTLDRTVGKGEYDSLIFA